MNHFNTLKLSILLIIMSSAISIKESHALTGNISYERFQRLNDPARKVSLDDWLGGSVKMKDQEDINDSGFDFFFEADARVYFNDKYELNYSVPEFYVSFKDRKNEVYIGRKIVDWNPNDQFWLLGHLNALQGFGLLSDKQEGLTGIHYNHQAGSIGISFFLSYVTIPSLNPSIDIKDGKVSSTSEWRKMPPTRTVYQGEFIDIRYNLNDPKISDLIFKKSVGLDLSYKWRTGKIHAFAIYKPESSIRVNADAPVVEVDGDFIVDVTANPIINSHAVYGGGFDQWIGPMKLSVGVDVIDPNARLGKDFKILNSNEGNRTFDSEFFKIQPSYDREMYAHAGFAYHGQTTVFSLNMIHLMSSNVREGDDFFSDTVKWKTAVGMRVKYAFSDTLSGTLDMRYDLERKDNIIKTEGTYNFWDHYAVTIGAELLKAPDKDSYWSAYRANDTLYANFAYNF